MSKQNKSNLNVTSTGEVVVDYFDWMQNPEDQQRKEKLNYLAALVEHYRQIEFIKRLSNAGFENMNEVVYRLLGQGDYVDNIMTYRLQTQNLLRLLATPNVMAAIREACPCFSGDTATMLDELLDFFIQLETAPYRTMLLFHDLVNDPTDDEHEIEKLTVEYEERIRSASTGKVKNAY